MPLCEGQSLLEAKPSLSPSASCHEHIQSLALLFTIQELMLCQKILAVFSFILELK
jgi:hypothetical protein